MRNHAFEYFARVIQPFLEASRSWVEFIGEVGGPDKDRLLGEALALLFPIDWPEPFGLVMIEAMACGTPVVAWRHGSVPEVIADGVTGFVVDRVDKAVCASGPGRLKSKLRVARRLTPVCALPGCAGVRERLVVVTRARRRWPATVV